MARQQTPADGGRPCWFIREDADPAFARVRFPEQMACDLRQLSAEQRARFDERLRILQGWEKACAVGVAAGRNKGEVTALFLQALDLERGIQITAKALYDWKNRYRRFGPAGLVDGRCQRRQAKGDERMAEYFVRLMLDQRQHKAMKCWEIAEQKAKEEGWDVFSYDTCLRRFKKVHPAVQILQRKGQKAFEDLAEPFIERDYSTLRSNELWNADHHEFDVVITHGGKHVRPWLTAFQDCRSRKIVGWHIGVAPPNTDTIILALRHGIKTHGIPETVHTDNGKDFDSYAFYGRTKRQKHKVRVHVDGEQLQGIYARAQIRACNVEPYHGQSKPIERFFGTLEERFSKTAYSTYCGNKPENRPEDLQKHLDAGEAPTLEEFVSAFADWLESDYHARGHQGDGMDGRSPAVVFEACLESKRTAPEEMLDLMLQKPSRPVKVTQKGVTWNGLGYGKYSLELAKHLGQEVTLGVDPLRIGEVTVWTVDGRWICRAECNKRLPANATAEQMREAMAEKRRHSKAIREYAEAAPHLVEDNYERLLRRSREEGDREAKRQPLPTPPAIRPLQSPMVAQMPAIQRAMQQPVRKAVGASVVDLLAAAEDLPLYQPKRRAPVLDLMKIGGDDE